MFKTLIARRAAHLTLAAAALAATTLGNTTSASAATVVDKHPVALASETTFDLPNRGDSALMPTWGWGGTTLCAFNYGGGSGLVELQAIVGFAGPEHLRPRPHRSACVTRWWFGNPVRVTNLSDNGVEVTGS